MHNIEDNEKNIDLGNEIQSEENAAVEFAKDFEKQTNSAGNSSAESAAHESEEESFENFAQNWEIPEDIKADYGTSEEESEDKNKWKLSLLDVEPIESEEIKKQDAEKKRMQTLEKKQNLKRKLGDVARGGVICLAGAAAVSTIVGGFTEMFADVAGRCYVRDDLKAQGIEYKKISDGFEFYKDDNLNYLYGTVRDKSGQEWDVYYDLRGTEHGKIKDPVNFANATRELEPIVVERKKEIPEELSR